MLCVFQYGNKSEDKPQHFLTFLIWVGSIFRDDFDIVIHEITELHPESILEYFFGETHFICVIRFAPWLLGWPVRRPRKYTLLVNQARMLWLGSADEFEKIFACTVEVAARELFCAPEPMVEAFFTAKAHEKGKMPATGSLQDKSQIYTPAQKRRLREYQAASTEAFV